GLGSCGHAGERIRHAFEAEYASALDEDTVAGCELRAEQRQRLAGVGRTAAPVDARALADRDQHVDADLRDSFGDLTMRVVAVAAELRHLTQHGDTSPPGGKRSQVLERGAHR